MIWNMLFKEVLFSAYERYKQGQSIEFDEYKKHRDTLHLPLEPSYVSVPLRGKGFVELMFVLYLRLLNSHVYPAFRLFAMFG